jgi:hypothetical protein
MFSDRDLGEANVAYGSITSFRACDVDLRFTLDTGRIAASQRTVETGQFRTHAVQQMALAIPSLDHLVGANKENSRNV